MKTSGRCLRLLTTQIDGDQKNNCLSVCLRQKSSLKYICYCNLTRMFSVHHPDFGVDIDGEHNSYTGSAIEEKNGTKPIF